MNSFKIAFASLVAAGFSTPAWASGGVPLPEPSGLMLLGLGVAGVIVGRHLSSKREND